MENNHLLFSWQKPKNKGPIEAIKWQHGTGRFEIHSTILEDLELERLLPHCVEVRHKIQTVATANHLGPSLFRVFPRTLSTVLQSIWDNITSLEEIVGETPFSFELALRHFIASHATTEDRHELLQQLRAPRKPREVKVQAFYYRLKELNSYVAWMPGNEAPLNAEELKRAFHDAMPPTWRERLVRAGRSHNTMTEAEVVRYFRQQENLAVQKQAENTATQRRESKAKRRNTSHGAPKQMNKRKNHDEPDKPNDNNKKRKAIQTDDPCPIHPGTNHTWGQCFANAYNKNKRSNKDNKPMKSDKAANKKDGDAFAITANDDEDPPTDLEDLEALSGLDLDSDSIINGDDGTD